MIPNSVRGAGDRFDLGRQGHHKAPGSGLPGGHRLGHRHDERPLGRRGRGGGRYAPSAQQEPARLRATKYPRLRRIGGPPLVWGKLTP